MINWKLRLSCFPAAVLLLGVAKANTVTAILLSTSVVHGSVQSGGLTNLGASDDSRYVLTSAVVSGHQTISWTAKGTFGVLLHPLSSITVTIEAQKSMRYTAIVQIWNASTSAWEKISAQDVGIVDVIFSGTKQNGSHYVNSNRVVKVRVIAAESSVFSMGTDLLKIVGTY